MKTSTSTCSVCYLKRDLTRFSNQEGFFVLQSGMVVPFFSEGYQIVSKITLKIIAFLGILSLTN